MEPTIPTPTASMSAPAFQPPSQVNSSFSFITLLLGLFFGVVIAGFGFFYYLNYYKNTNDELSNVPTIESNNLSSVVATSNSPSPSTVKYTNEKYGYSFDYPYEWIMEPEKSVVDQVNKIYSIINVHADNKEGIPSFSVEIRGKNPPAFYYTTTEKLDISIDGAKYTAYIFPNGYECYEGSPSSDCSFFVIPIKKDDLWYVLRATGSIKNIPDLYIKILESFKFKSVI